MLLGATRCLVMLVHDAAFPFRLPANSCHRRPLCVAVCANDATWQPARATAAANSGYTAAWQALGGPSFVFDTSQVTPKGSFTPGKMFGTALNSLIYNPDSPMWGTNSTNLTCAWWFPTSPL